MNMREKSHLRTNDDQSRKVFKSNFEFDTKIMDVRLKICDLKEQIWQQEPEISNLREQIFDEKNVKRTKLAN